MSTKAELLKVIKLQCEECMGSTIARKGESDGEARNLVRGCTVFECSLFPFKMGTDPWKKRKGDVTRFKKVVFNPPVVQQMR